jgi:hypothetical protein
MRIVGLPLLRPTSSELDFQATRTPVMQRWRLDSEPLAKAGFAREFTARRSGTRAPSTAFIRQVAELNK